MNIKKPTLSSGAQFLMTILLLFLIYHLARQAAMLTSVSSSAAASPAASPVVVLDSGHGGWDPGKVGIDGSLEKDLNLAIALKLKNYLEASGVTVIMTRDGDYGLYDERDSNKKSADMANRCKLINDAAPALTVSIHQNSYHEEPIHGGQVFYYKKSQQGQQLAEIKTLRLCPGPDQHQSRQSQRQLLPSSPCPLSHRHSGMRIFEQRLRRCKPKL